MPCTASGYVTKTRVNNSLGTWNIPRILFNGIENFLGLGGGEGGGGQGTGREGRVNRRMPGRGRGDVSVLGRVVWGVVSRRVRRIYTTCGVFDDSYEVCKRNQISERCFVGPLAILGNQVAPLYSALKKPQVPTNIYRS